MLHSKPYMLARLSLAVLCLLTMASCATKSPPLLPEVVEQVKIPQPPQVAAPLPSGSYWQKHCELMAKVQTALNLTVTPCEHS
jgi:hypothetical protein